MHIRVVNRLLVPVMIIAALAAAPRYALSQADSPNERKPTATQGAHTALRKFIGVSASSIVAGDTLVTRGKDKTVTDVAAKYTAAAKQLAQGYVSPDPLKPARVLQALSSLKPEATPLVTRGQAQGSLYLAVSPSVVLIANLEENGLGSGSLVTADGLIVTNQHVVGNAREVGVIFKPRQEGQAITESDLVRAEVIRIDQVADLALLQVSQVPRTSKPIALGTPDSVYVGSDVQAIGHPIGEVWTYTRGVISQIHNGYKWQTGGLRHQANVFQTQTPISPGNSGGPLLNDAGQLVGVNTFSAEGQGVSGINYAVTVEEVQRLLRAPVDRLAETSKAEKAPESAGTPKGDCEPQALKQARTTDPGPGAATTLDLDCDGTADAIQIIPDDPNEPIFLLFDSNKDGSIDTTIEDTDRDGHPDQGLFDTDGDGHPDLMGYFKDGADKPYRYEKYNG